MSNLIIGNKYVPISKNDWGPLEISNHWKEAQKINQPFLYYVGTNSLGGNHIFHVNNVLTGLIGGDFFLESDVIPYEEEFILPEFWCVKSTDESDEELIKWRGGGYTSRPVYCCSRKYWIAAKDLNKYTEISFEQFKKYVLKQEFVLPEQWCIKDCKEVSEWVAEKWDCGNQPNEDTYYHHGRTNGHKDYVFLPSIQENFTEITLNEFKTHVLKIKTNNMKQIGWKFKAGCEIYKDAAIAIAAVNDLDDRKDKTIFTTNSVVADRMKNANVLELWFEPVYEEKIKIEAEVWYVKEWNSDNNNNFDIFLIDKVEEDDYYMSVYYRDGRFLETCPIYKRSLSEMVEDSRHLLRKATFEEIGIAKSYKELKIAGYKAEKVKDGIKFGCQTIPTSVLYALENLMERDVFTTTLKIESTEITLDIIKKLKNL